MVCLVLSRHYIDVDWIVNSVHDGIDSTHYTITSNGSLIYYYGLLLFVGTAQYLVARQAIVV